MIAGLNQLFSIINASRRSSKGSVKISGNLVLGFSEHILRLALISTSKDRQTPILCSFQVFPGSEHLVQIIENAFNFLAIADLQG